MEKNGDSFFFSVVVPVYNVKKYLRKCVQSIAEQEDFGDTFEIILIDDGSCDGSEYICEELEAQYSFLHVIHQKNAGLGAARNAGIRLAKGKYLLFVDADDFISKDSLYHIWAEVKKNRADLYFLESRKYYETGKRSMVNDGRLKMVSSLGKAECMKLFSILSRYPGSAWDKLVRRDFILENQIFFEEHVLSEDLIWVLKCLYLQNPIITLRRIIIIIGRGVPVLSQTETRKGEQRTYCMRYSRELFWQNLRLEKSIREKFIL